MKARAAVGSAKTDEAKISGLLLQTLLSDPTVIVHSWHPPSSKAYFGPLVRVPKKIGGVRSRERYHLDGIVQIERYLLLVELKGLSADLASDVIKLNELMAAYTLDEFVEVLSPRVHDKPALGLIREWVPLFGYWLNTGSEPDTGLVVGPLSESHLTVRDNGSVPAQLTSRLRTLLSVP